MSLAVNWDAAGGGANVNLNNTYEPLGWPTTGSAPYTNYVAGSTIGVVNATPVTMGTTANDWAGFFLFAMNASSSSGRVQIDLSFDNGATWAVQGLHIDVTNNGNVAPIRLPIKSSAGSVVKVRQAATTANMTTALALVGIVRNASSAPGYTSMVALNLDTTNTRAAVTPTAFSALTSPTWQTLKDPTAAAYAGLFVAYGASGSTPATSQNIKVSIALGASGSEVEISRDMLYVLAASLSVPRTVGHVIEKVIPSGSRISASVAANTPGSDNLGVGVYGLVT